VEEVVVKNLINYGAIGIVLGYFIWKDYKMTNEIKDTLNGVKEILNIVKDLIIKKEG